MTLVTEEQKKQIDREMIANFNFDPSLVQDQLRALPDEVVWFMFGMFVGEIDNRGQGELIPFALLRTWKTLGK